MNSFITDEVIAKILNSVSGNGCVTGLSWRIESETSPSGYCSDVYRIHVMYLLNEKPCSKSLFLKIPYNCAMYNQLSTTGMYEKEIYIYQRILPALHTMLDEKRLAPLFYLSDNRHALILEDLSNQGYRICDRRQQLNFEQCVHALKHLAKFHAASVKLHQTSPQVFDDIMHKSPWDNSLESDLMTSSLRDRFVRAFREVDPAFADEHAEELMYYKNKFVDLLKQEMKTEERTFNVLNHGDMWGNNILFKYDKYQEVQDVRFVDFQLSRWSSPAIDLLYFIQMACQFEVFEKYFDLLLETYAIALNRALRFLQCNCEYSIDDLRRDIESKSNYSVFLLVYMMPLVLTEGPLKAEDINDEKILTSQFYKTSAKKWFSYFIQKGIFSPPTDTTLVISTFIRKFQARNNVTVTKKTLEDSVVETGTNYFSGIRRLTIEYQNNHGNDKFVKSFILKIPSLSTIYTRFKASSMFENEVHMYQKFLRAMYTFWDGDPFTPTLYSATKTKAMVLEDLQSCGFHINDKLKQLDLDHSKAALQMLAQFHALSVKHHQKYGDSMDPIAATEFRLSSSCEAFSFRTYEKFLETVRPIISQTEYQTLENYGKNFFLTTCLMNMNDAHGFLVLCHGDFWTNNIMFQHDDQNRVIGSKLVDFQLSRRASPVIDLIFFFVTSVQFNVFDLHYDDLIRSYLDTLNETLNSLDSGSKYNRSRLNNDMRKFKFLFTYTLSTMVPVILSGVRESNILDEESTAELFRSQRYLTLLLNWIPHLIKKKFF